LISALLERMHEISFRKGDMLIRQDARGHALQVLLEGRAAVVVTSDVDDPTEVAEVAAGDVVGEMALISGEPTSADVVARGPGRALSLAAEDFHELASKHPEIAVVLTRLIADRLGGPHADALGGKHVHGYHILRCVGQGGMAVVYEAARDGDGKRVALKMMSHRLIYDSRALSRFREETQLLDRFEHDNLARLFDRFSAYGTHFLVMEFCDGIGLDRLVARRVPFPEGIVRPITGQIAAALEYVHGMQVLHRDIKPGNVILTHAGQIKLIDFGVARPVERLDDSTRTHESSIVGTPFYMAPEQFEESTEIDERVDRYALACMTYELLAGKRLFRKDTSFGMLRQKMQPELPPRESIGHGVGEEMYDFLGRNIDPERGNRSTSLAAQAAWAAPVDVDALTRGG
jgi:serine/threonine protein kinase